MYEKIKKITIWIPLIGVILMIVFEKNMEDVPMYDLYFDWGSPLLVPISAVWQAVCIIFCWWLIWG